MFNPFSIGVSLEPGRVSAVLLKEGLFGVKPIDCKSREVPENYGPRETVGIINGLLQEMVDRNKVRYASVCLGLPEDMVTFRFIEMPSAVKENLKGALGYELDKYVPFLPEAVYYDCQIVDEDKEKAIIKVLLLVVKKSLLAPFLEVGIGESVSLSRIEIAAAAVGSFLFHRGGRGKTGALCVLTVSGSHVVFSAVEKGRLKHMVKIGTSAPVSAKKAVQAGLGEMGTVDGPFDKCYYPFSELPATAERLLADINLSAAPIDLNAISLPDAQYITAYGLGVDAFGTAPNEINLLPDALKKKSGRTGFYIMIGLAGMLVICAMFYGGSLFYQKKSAMDELEAKAGRLRQKIEAAGQIQKKYDRIASDLRFLNDFSGRAPLIEILTELSDIIPRDSWIHEFNCSESEIKIQGSSDSASKLISLLEGSVLFDNASFLSTIRKIGKGKERFHIGVEIESE
ncbi:MAG: PilN domain-containing protein [Desulfobacterales bacterium]|nr:PilN domain-containing protein [Desulfobacterales bacterium]